MSVITIPKVLRNNLGEEGADAFTQVIREVDMEARKDAISIAEERFERRLTEETGKINERITQEIGNVNERITQEIGNINERITKEIGELKTEIAKNKSELIKWMFIFWIGQTGVIVGVIIALFKLL